MKGFKERVTLAVGQILDRYEILEQVGQGGMAVVYRGLDRSLHRQVAVKVLHSHLAQHAEARERFAREARAVAKLRHENILEIFDFAGEDALESYIVTELIDGPTLTQLIADHPPRYPEIGAMIAAQVCRALAHAHSFGILHRDVKPENIMIRADGVVKLTDFGIAQMLDMQRMTQTGQLMGSPAYMSPEHLEGNPLDFRTDIFAVGVVLYQLVVGDLPFRGRNPHELLKRIAEGVYRDPRQANPLVGNELGRIIDRALARAKEDRYPDVTEMLAALERYLENSGIRDCREELARYFEAPVPYELALRARVLDALSRRGRELLAVDKVAALDLFNRVLTLDPDNREILGLVEQASRRRRGMRIVALFGVVLALVAVAYGIDLLWFDDDERSATDDATRPEASPSADEARARAGTAARIDPASSTRPTTMEPTAPPLAAGGADRATADPSVHVSGPQPGPSGQNPGPGEPAGPGQTGGPGEGTARAQRPSLPPVSDRTAQDAGAGPAPSPGLRSFTLNVSPLKSEYRVDDGSWNAIPRGRATIEVGPGAHVVEVRNTACCESDQQTIAATDAGGGELDFTLGYLPAIITPQCPLPGVGVQIDGQSARLDRKHPIFMTRSLGQRPVVVTFFNQETTDEHVVQVQYNETKVVTCAFR
jgi:tRNA A-37 threonylcarbamoyl transferase component Bud32